MNCFLLVRVATLKKIVIEPQNCPTSTSEMFSSVTQISLFSVITYKHPASAFFFFYIMCKVCKGLHDAFLWCVAMWSNRPTEKYHLETKTASSWSDLTRSSCSIASHISSTFPCYEVLAIWQKKKKKKRKIGFLLGTRQNSTVFFSGWT